jgi:hypothetical protein
LFTTGPGPDAGGSNPGKEGWDHMPEKSGMAAAPLAGSAAGVTVCAEAGIAARVANATNKRKSRRCTPMIFPRSYDLPVFLRVRTNLV